MNPHHFRNGRLRLAVVPSRPVLDPGTLQEVGHSADAKRLGEIETYSFLDLRRLVLEARLLSPLCQGGLQDG